MMELNGYRSEVLFMENTVTRVVHQFPLVPMEIGLQLVYLGTQKVFNGLVLFVCMNYREVFGNS